MNCFKCGYPANDGDIFCLRCGAKLTDQSSVKNAETGTTQSQGGQNQWTPIAGGTSPAIQGDNQDSSSQHVNCFKCGYPANDGDIFCLRCGAKLTDQSSVKNVETGTTQSQGGQNQWTPIAGETSSAIQSDNQDSSSQQGSRPPMQCPKCGYSPCQILSESSTQGRDYDAGQGCMGAILFGPIGLLCGLCGEGKQTTTTHYFYCPNCGNKYSV